MKIGLLSDTHSYLDPQIFHHFAACDQIWHAGDIGSMEIIDRLEAFKPLKIVYGNIDGADIRRRCQEDLFFTCEGMRVLLTHIAGKPPTFTPRMRALLQRQEPDLLVCGHSHILRVSKHHGLYYLNPGAAGRYGMHTVRTLVRFDINHGKLSNMEVIELVRHA